MNEFEVINNLWKPLCEGSDYALNLEDDAAVLPFSDDKDLVISKDLLNEKTHFFQDTPAPYVASRLIRTNLSDLAAMGAEPLGYFLGIATTNNNSAAWLKEFSQSLYKEMQLFGGRLLGGDTTTSHNPYLALSLTTLGTVPRGHALLRSHAKTGDDIYVTGTIGDSYLALHMLKGELPKNDTLISRYHTPTPRLAISQQLRSTAHAAIDISDGLAADLEHLCHASNCGATLSIANMPLSIQAQEIIAQHNIPLTKLLTGGDDYELIFTAAPKDRKIIQTIAANTQTPVCIIGSITEDDKVLWLDEESQHLVLKHKGYQHINSID